MAQQNSVSFQLTEKEISAVNMAVATLKSILLSRLKTLSPEERHQLPKMGEKTVSFVNKVGEYCGLNPELVPQYIDTSELKIDVRAVDTLRQIYQPLRQIADALDDTILLSGSEAYTCALVYYHSVKNAAKTGIQGAKTIYDDLSERFPGRPKNNKTSGDSAIE